jgi:hypothetical protein
MLPFVSAMLLGSAAAVIPISVLGDWDTSITASNGGLTATKNATNAVAYAFGKGGKISGKWRYQVTVGVVGGDMSFGITGGLYVNRDTFLGCAGSNGIGVNSTASTGVLYNGTTQYGYTTTNMTAGDVWDVYLDADIGRVWFSRAGVVLNGNPAAGTGGTSIAAMKKAYYPAAYLYGANSALTFNFGATAFTYTGVAGFNAWTATAAPASRTQFRSFAMLVRSLGWFGQAWAETELMTVSGGANMLAGSTASGSIDYFQHNATYAYANSIDANTTTFVDMSTNAGSAQNQGPVWIAYELAANATRNAAFMAIRGRDGGGGGEQQAPTLFDLWVSDGAVATGNWYKETAGISLTAFAATTPGQRKEFAL